MKSAAVIVTLLTLFTSAISAHSEHEAFPLRHRHARRAGHKHTHKRHHALPAVKRSGQCQFPTDCGLVPVTPNAQNAGWAMSPDQPCTPGNFCPYACPSGISYRVQYLIVGQVMAQWDPAATSYVYPLNMVCSFVMDLIVARWIILQFGWKYIEAVPQQTILCRRSRHLHRSQRSRTRCRHVSGTPLNNTTNCRLFSPEMKQC
jgi:hypothetical protein